MESYLWMSGSTTVFLHLLNHFFSKMKHLALFFIVLLCACNTGNNNQAKMQPDSASAKPAAVYKPGLGEFMSGIQVHHAKLWFAGINQNWKLADFEMHEIGESMDNIRQFNTDRPEVKSLTMIDAPLDSVNVAIQKKDLNSFKKSFNILTNTCNTCHRATDHGFNVVKMPDSPPFSNQDFSPQTK
jgi:hypothetical protein